VDDVEKRKFFTLPGFEFRPLGRPVRSQSLYRLSYPGSLRPRRPYENTHRHLMSFRADSDLQGYTVKCDAVLSGKYLLTFLKNLQSREPEIRDSEYLRKFGVYPPNLDATPCDTVEVCLLFTCSCFLLRLFFDSEDGGNIFLRNIDEFL
jgi:hypothetical protein